MYRDMFPNFFENNLRFLFLHYVEQWYSVVVVLSLKKKSHISTEIFQPGNQSSRSEQLQHVTLNTINQNVCVQRYANLKSQPGNEDYPDVTSSMICAGILNIGGRDTCRGDAGGPLIHNNNDSGHVIMGITSWGFGCGHPYFPGVYVRVSVLADWIVRNGSV